ncbi:MAG: hypothetical protein IT293_17895 [Deltaproteobacteria bacterium]|nr:hypothetical protein [Deltaproteobacteria bacterium]
MRITSRLRVTIGMRRWRAVMTALVLVGAAERAHATPPPCVAGPEPPRDVNGYLLFAYTDLYVKGGTAAVPGRGLFTGGHLGSNGIATVGDPNATLGTNYGVYLSDGKAAVADRVTLGPGHPLMPTSVWDLFTNVIDNNDFTPSSVRNAGPICFAPPIIDTGLPSFVAFTHPGGPYQPVLPSFPSEAALNALADVQLPAGFLLNLAPGDYGDVDINDDGILNLAAGVYNLHSLQTGRNVTINTTAGTEVRIAVDFRSNNDLTIQGSDLARFYVRSDGLGPSIFSFTLGYNTDPTCAETIAVHGQFFVPNGRVNLGDCTNIFGRVWADVIRNDTNINVTYRAGASLRGTKYLDADADGAIDPGESGLAGVTFYVDYDDDGVLDPGEPFGTSDASGHYEIDDVAAGTWRLRELDDPGLVCSFPVTCSWALTIGDGEVQSGFDFANWTGISKTGTKFEDLDADGSPREAGEPGLAGWTIYVDYDDDGGRDPGEPFGVTDAGGSYTIVNIAAGTWKVREVGQPGWTCSFPATADAFGCHHEETFVTGTAYPNNDFGNWRGATKSGTKFSDADRDGVRDASEPGLAGWTIYVDYDGDGALGPEEPFGITDATGAYAITGILPGTWRVREVQQSGWTCSFPAVADAFGCYHEEMLTSGSANPGNDFGNWSDGLGHFQCYEIHRPAFDRAGVSLVDALGPSIVTIKRAKRICAPADKNGEDPTAPLDPEHFTYYTLKQTTPFTKVKGVTVDNQFGSYGMALTKPDRLLVPTAKSLTDPAAPLTRPVDHYKCYKVAGAKTKVPGLVVTDQFGTIVVDVKQPLHLCLPAVKNDEGPLVDPGTALMCYKVTGLPPAVRPGLFTLNQFGPDAYDFFGPRDLCVPSTVTLP